jgi:DNA transposition AAA+ family ATPase
MSKTATPPEADEPVDTGTPQPIATDLASQHNQIAINLDATRHLPQDQQDEIIWFHQHMIDSRIGCAAAGQLINYDASVVSRVLRGSYAGDYAKVCQAIRSYKAIHGERLEIQNHNFAETRTTKLIWQGLSYALSNNSITIIQGESRMGKTCAALAWRDANNHGRTVYVEAPVNGSLSALTIAIAGCLGIGRRNNDELSREAIYRAFNQNRMLIIDEAARLVPGSANTMPRALEFARSIHDRTGCGLALISTSRFGMALDKSQYQWEQLVGRVGMPIRLFRKAEREDVLPILIQYIPEPTEPVVEMALDIANKPGRLGILVETLKIASKIAAKRKVKLSEEHFKTALRTRQEMMGETKFAAR